MAQPKQIKQKQLIGFLKTHNNPRDIDVHRWANKHNYKVDRVEEGLYKIATKITETRRPTSCRRIKR